MANDLLLLSSSVVHGSGYLAYAMELIQEFLDGRSEVVFAPFASRDHVGYTSRVQTTLAPLGVTVTGLHAIGDPGPAIQSAGALFVGGGNTFRLLRDLYRLNLIDVIRRAVADGSVRYMGASAGTNVACPTMRTTNDMPIVQPPGLDALGLVPFQINPHYQDPDPDSTHRGETREERIMEFLEENDVPVLGLGEGSWLLRLGASLTLGGEKPARLFHRGRDPREFAPGSALSALLASVPRFDVN
ncbi:dipeptidase PepE [soil metagenome]